MAMKRCPVCGEKYSDTYRYCPFCEEADLDQEEDPRRASGRSGRRVGVGSPRRPNLMTPVLVVLILLMAALLVYLLWGDKLTGKDKDKDPDNKPGVEDPITPDKPGQKDPAAQEPVAADPTVTDPDVTDPEEPNGQMPQDPAPGTPGGTTQPAAPAQQHRQQQDNQLHAASAPGPRAPGAGRLFLLPAVSAGVADRAGAQAFSALLYRFGGAGHVFLPASGAIVLHR